MTSRVKCEVIYEMFHIYAQYMKHLIHHFIPILHGLRTHKWPAPNVIAQLVRASHRYREITGSNPVELLTFLGFYTQLLKLRSQLRQLIIAYLISNPQFNTWNILYITSRFLYIQQHFSSLVFLHVVRSSVSCGGAYLTIALLHKRSCLCFWAIISLVFFQMVSPGAH